MVRMDKEEDDEEMMNTYQTSYTTGILEDARRYHRFDLVRRGQNDYDAEKIV